MIRRSDIGMTVLALWALCSSVGLAKSEDAQPGVAQAPRGADLASPITGGKHAHQVCMSIGVALIPDDGATEEAILRNADLAMYRAKDLHNALVFFAPEMSERRQIA